MNYLTVIILIFSMLGALDRIFGNRLGLGKEFEKAFMLLGAMALSMIGMMDKMDKKVLCSILHLRYRAHSRWEAILHLQWHLTVHM